MNTLWRVAQKCLLLNAVLKYTSGGITTKILVRRVMGLGSTTLYFFAIKDLKCKFHMNAVLQISRLCTRCWVIQ